MEIAVKNAGLVLLNSYIPMLFERLGLLSEDRKFISKESQLSAVGYLQYVATGLADTNDSFTPLNKVLCGLAVTESISTTLTISEENQRLISSLIDAVINHWPAIGQSSIDGFRGNWLVRDGYLTENNDRWELTVERRVYDILINKSPFAFSVIKYQWMEKPLYVNWSF